MNQNENSLRRYRLSKGLEPLDVDREMNWGKGKTAKYERDGFLQIPCCDLSKLINFYNVSLFDFYRILDSEMDIKEEDLRD